MKFFKKLLHKHIKKTRVQTVQLRGRLSDADNEFLKADAKKHILSAGGVAKKVQNSQQPIFFEVGFGNGSHIVELARSNNSTLVLGSEMYMAGVVNTLRSSLRQEIANLFVTSSDARVVLKKMPEGSLERVYTLFPDPWPKVRHNKRRLVKKDFIELVLSKIKLGGLCVIATDWADYAEEIIEVVQTLQKSLFIVEGELTKEETQNIFKTTFALRAQKEGREISLFVLKKIN